MKKTYTIKCEGNNSKLKKCNRKTSKPLPRNNDNFFAEGKGKLCLSSLASDELNKEHWISKKVIP